MILIGTIHVDLEGPKRLEHLLNRVGPKRVSLECPNRNPQDIKELLYRQRREVERIISQANIPDILRQASLDSLNIRGYEFLTALDYCTRAGASLFLVDHPKVLIDNPSYAGIREALEEQGRMFNEDCLRIPYTQIRKATMTYLDKAYYDPKILKEIGELMLPTTQELIRQTTASLFVRAFMEEREQFMAEKISGLKPDLHIGGLAHAFEGFGNLMGLNSPLYARLGSLITERVRLCEEDKSMVS